VKRFLRIILHGFQSLEGIVPHEIPADPKEISEEWKIRLK
jgi:hypothetical protein